MNPQFSIQLQKKSILTRVYCRPTVGVNCYAFLVGITPSLLLGRSSTTSATAHLKCPRGCCSPEIPLPPAGASQNSQRPGILMMRRKYLNQDKHTVFKGMRTFLDPSHFCPPTLPFPLK